MQARSFPSQPSSVDHDPERGRERERDNGSAPAPTTLSTAHGQQHYGKSVNGAMSSLDSTGTPEPAGQAPYAASAESTPLPLPNTPSTTFSYPYRVPATTQRRARSSHGHGHTSDSGVEKGRARTTNGGPRRHHRSREEPSVVTFDEHAGLTKDQIQKAASLTVIAQSGIRVQFGELFKDRKTIVIFIRHFWCVHPTTFCVDVCVG